jgi:hypothetical protein
MLFWQYLADSDAYGISIGRSDGLYVDAKPIAELHHSYIDFWVSFR